MWKWLLSSLLQELCITYENNFFVHFYKMCVWFLHRSSFQAGRWTGKQAGRCLKMGIRLVGVWADVWAFVWVVVRVGIRSGGWAGSCSVGWVFGQEVILAGGILACGHLCRWAFGWSGWQVGILSGIWAGRWVGRHSCRLTCLQAFRLAGGTWNFQICKLLQEVCITCDNNCLVHVYKSSVSHMKIIAFFTSTRRLYHVCTDLLRYPGGRVWLGYICKTESNYNSLVIFTFVTTVWHLL